MKKTKSDPMLKFMDALDFSLEDLEANRQGFMSHSQRSRMRKRKSSMVWGHSIVIVMFICLIVIMMNAVQYDLAVMALVFLGILTGVALYKMSDLSRQYSADLEKGHVRSVEGFLITRIGMSDSYSLVIHDKRFNVSQKVYEAFRSNQPYILYFTPNTNTVLSAETSSLKPTLITTLKRPA